VETQGGRKVTILTHKKEKGKAGGERCCREVRGDQGEKEGGRKTADLFHRRRGERQGCSSQEEEKRSASATRRKKKIASIVAETEARKGRMAISVREKKGKRSSPRLHPGKRGEESTGKKKNVPHPAIRTSGEGRKKKKNAENMLITLPIGAGKEEGWWIEEESRTCLSPGDKKERKRLRRSAWQPVCEGRGRKQSGKTRVVYPSRRDGGSWRFPSSTSRGYRKKEEARNVPFLLKRKKEKEFFSPSRKKREDKVY